MHPDHELIMALGRVEGKLDVSLQLQTQQGKRIDALDERLSGIETDVVTLQAARSTNLNWITIGIAALGLIVAAVPLILGAIHG